MRRGNWTHCWLRFRQEVETFEAASPQDINILFTTIQGLHSNLNTPRENALIYEDFNKQIVLISDKAHHINALAKSANNRNKSEAENVNPYDNRRKSS